MESTVDRRAGALRTFLRTEAAGGALLLAATAAALGWANSPWSHGYDRMWSIHLPLSLDLRHWVNDGLMAAFFLVVGLEIRRELTVGHLAGRRAATLPVAAAFGGMVVPAVVYLAVAGRSAAHGWGIPMATDIAFAVGVLAILGSRVPPRLKLFVLTLAIVDDALSILVIALAFGSHISFGWIAVTALLVAAYTVGPVSGCHVNPAVTLGLAAIKKCEWALTPFYIVGQVVGGLLGGLLIYLIVKSNHLFDMSKSAFASNGYGMDGSPETFDDLRELEASGRIKTRLTMPLWVKPEMAEAEWRARLSPAAYQVLREHGTERAYTSPLNGEKRPGRFVCAGCDLPLFSSKTKFESGTGWPSFNDPENGAVEETVDRGYGMVRTEVRSRDADSHAAGCAGAAA